MATLPWRRSRGRCPWRKATPRHGTRRRLSALTVGILLLSLARFAALAARVLQKLGGGKLNIGLTFPLDLNYTSTHPVGALSARAGASADGAQGCQLGVEFLTFPPSRGVTEVVR